MKTNELICMFCNKPIKEGESYTPSPYHDGTDAHNSCGNEAVFKYVGR